MKLLIVGLGEVGASVLEWVHDGKYDGVEVYGFDISPERVKYLRGMAFDDAVLSDTPPDIEPDVISLCVPCDDSFRPVKELLSTLTAKYGHKPLYSIESTLPRPAGVEELIDQGYAYDVIVYPHRVSPHDSDPQRRTAGGMARVMGGTPEAIARGMRFWAPIYGRKNIHAATWGIAVLSKVLENACRYVEIATCEQEALIARAFGEDPYKLQQAMATKWNAVKHTPLDGIGRHCLPKDVRFAAKMAPGGIYDAAVETDREYRETI